MRAAAEQRTGAPVRVMLVDDVEASRHALRRALAFDPTIEVVGEAGSGTEAIARAEDLRPDLILMDVRMPDGDGVEATERIVGSLPGTRVLALTVHDDVETVRDMLAAGATGYLLKGAPVDDLLSAVRRAYRGEGQIDSRILPEALDDLRRLLREEREQREEVERLARLRQEFIQILSHELRTPLTVMAGALRFMQRRGLRDDETALVSSALERSGELERMIEGLELIGELRPRSACAANPAQAVRDALERLREEPDAVHVEDDAWAGVRPHHLARVAQELTDNAVRHGRRPVAVSTFREGSDVVLQVTDEGDFAPRPELFDAFAQGDMSLTRERGGMGLGLFVAMRLCQADEGALSVRREGGRTVAEARYPARSD